jgi:hypothetical protein
MTKARRSAGFSFSSLFGRPVKIFLRHTRKASTLLASLHQPVWYDFAPREEFARLRFIKNKTAAARLPEGETR